jgi:hypothetical protein
MQKNWYGLIVNNCEILYPVDNFKNTCDDIWNIKCHCGRIFKTKPCHIQSGHTKSCHCLQDSINRRTGKAKQKLNFYNYVNNESKVIILKPVNPLETRGRDDWFCLCPLHNEPVEFICIPYSIISGATKSCGCLRKETAKQNSKLYNESKRLERGFQSNQLIISENELLRKNLFHPIRHLVFKLDNFTCKLCKKQNTYFHAHHIIPPFTSTNLSDINSFKLIYDLQNIITLCEDECHWKAHNNSSLDINQNIQIQLQNITNNRFISQEIFNTYNQIVKTEIEPWLSEYLRR